MQAVIVRPDAFQETHLTPLGRFDLARGRSLCSAKETAGPAGSVLTTWPL
jgi:hypothetical protein